MSVGTMSLVYWINRLQHKPCVCVAVNTTRLVLGLGGVVVSPGIEPGRTGLQPVALPTEL